MAFQWKGTLSQCYPIVSLIGLGNSLCWPCPTFFKQGGQEACYRALEGDSSCGALVGIPIRWSVRRTSYVTDWMGTSRYIGNPRSLKEGTKTYVPSPQSLDSAVAAVLLVRLLSENLKMQRTCCSLYTRAARWAAAAYDCMPMCIGTFSYTRSRLASLARFLFVGQSDIRLRSLLQGTRVTYVTETLSK